MHLSRPELDRNKSRHLHLLNLSISNQPNKEAEERRPRCWRLVAVEESEEPVAVAVEPKQATLGQYTHSTAFASINF
jgi:hypothetical protein